MVLTLTLFAFLSGIDLAFAMIIMGFLGFGYLISWDAAMNLLAKDFYDVVVTVGTLGILLPPSVTLIIYGIITDLSIGRLFLAGIFPGLMIATFFIAIIYG